MTHGFSIHLAKLCAAVLVALVALIALTGPVHAGSRDNAHFAKTFEAFCARMMNDLSPLYEFAQQQNLMVERRSAQSQRDNVQTAQFRMWALPHEGRRYLLSVDKLPNPQSRSGYINVCMLQSVKADIAGVAKQLQATFQRQVFELDPVAEFGSDSRTFVVKGYSDVGMLTLILSPGAGNLMSLTAMKIFD